MTASAERTIDAEGKAVTPGLLTSTHYDGQATGITPASSNSAQPLLLWAIAALALARRQEDHDVLIKLMEGVEEIPETAMSEGLPWDWEASRVFGQPRQKPEISMLRLLASRPVARVRYV